jgi:Lar family restriction alleviation protein
MSELKPCPFCGSSEITVVKAFGDRYCYCDKCYASTASAECREVALSFWNARPEEERLRAAVKHVVLDHAPLIDLMRARQWGCSCDSTVGMCPCIECDERNLYRDLQTALDAAREAAKEVQGG